MLGAGQGQGMRTAVVVPAAAAGRAARLPAPGAHHPTAPAHRPTRPPPTPAAPQLEKEVQREKALAEAEGRAEERRRNKDIYQE